MPNANSRKNGRFQTHGVRPRHAVVRGSLRSPGVGAWPSRNPSFGLHRARRVPVDFDRCVWRDVTSRPVTVDTETPVTTRNRASAPGPHPRPWHAATVLSAVALLCACGRSAPPGPPQMPPARGQAVTVQPREIAVHLRVCRPDRGRARSRRCGRASPASCKNGTTPRAAAVQAGQSLFTIDPAPFRGRAGARRRRSGQRRSAAGAERARHRAPASRL